MLDGGFWCPRGFWISYCMRERGFVVALIFIFFDPCAGRHLLFLLRQKK
jgi:hypothetical protein